MTLEESSAEMLAAAAPMAEAPAEEDWLTGAADGDRTGAALDENPTIHSQQEANSVGRAFLVLRLAGAVSILCAFAFLVTLGTSQGGWTVWAGTGGFLAYLAFAAEALLRWMQRRLQ